jgi:hypothetical protein
MWAAEAGNAEGVRIILQSGRADVTVKGNVRTVLEPAYP